MQPTHEFKYTFDTADPIGEKTLDAIAKADRFNNWMYQTVKPFLKGHILEIGSGIGNISALILQDNFEVRLSDLRQTYCDSLSKKFKPRLNLSGIEKINLTNQNFEIEYASLLGKFDSIIALNVIEHIEHDSLALENCYKLLSANGHVIILVPAYQWLYNRFDKGLEHFRRYTTTKMSDLIKAGGFNVSHSQYFNFMGIFGWFLFGKLLKKESIPETQMSLYNRLVPAFKWIDKIVFNKIGLSVVVIGQKKDENNIDK